MQNYPQGGTERNIHTMGGGGGSITENDNSEFELLKLTFCCPVFLIFAALTAQRSWVPAQSVHGVNPALALRIRIPPKTYKPNWSSLILPNLFFYNSSSDKKKNFFLFANSPPSIGSSLRPCIYVSIIFIQFFQRLRNRLSRCLMITENICKIPKFCGTDFELQNIKLCTFYRF